MSRCCNFARRVFALIPVVLAVFAIASCGRHGESGDEAQIRQTFKSWQEAVIDSHLDKAMAYLPRNVYDYFRAVNLGEKNAAVVAPLHPSPSESPGVDLLLRTALDRKVTVASGQRTDLTLDNLVQRAADKRLFKPRDVQEIKLGYISVNGSRASADIYYQGTLTALRLPFVKERDEWKIDVLAILPYVEVLMRVDRAIKGETEAQQVDRLVNAMPVL